MYKTVLDLSYEELEELKESYFWDPDSDEVLGDKITSPHDIPDSLMFEHYKGVMFTEEDFFCNLKEV